MSTSAIKLANVSKSFNYEPKQLRTGFKTLFKLATQKQILRDISLSIENKQTVGLYGPNGAGKSTLLRLMAGILKSDAGEIQVNGSVAAVLELGSGFNPELTGRENIDLYSTLIGLSQGLIESKLTAIIDFAGLAEAIDLPLKKYSSGMKARLAFSIVAFSNTDILLLDEVFAVGDRDFLDKSRQLIEDLKKTKTIVLSSHNLQLLQGFCDRIIKLKEGQIDQSGEYCQLLFDLPFGEKIKVEIISNSMYPLIRKNDQATVIRVPLSEIKVGDVVAVYFKNIQELVVHRVVAQKGSELFLKGDHNFAPDQWLVGEHNLLGKVEI